MDTRIVQVVCAVSMEGIFGEGTGLAWKFGKLNEDFRRFVENTPGTVIMGRITWESLPPNARPLKGRTNIVVSGSKDYKADGATVCASLDEALALATTETISIIGGVGLVKEAVSRGLVDTAHITVVNKTLPSTDQTKYFIQLLSERFWNPLVCLSIESHSQPTADGGTVMLEFRHYERGDV